MPCRQEYFQQINTYKLVYFGGTITNLAKNIKTIILAKSLTHFFSQNLIYFQSKQKFRLIVTILDER